MFFYIIGWIFISWLTLSTIYSTYYHLQNYFSSKENETLIAQNLDSLGEIKEMYKKDFLKKVLFKQCYKIVTILIVLYFLIP
jgi:hypothetical protein